MLNIIMSTQYLLCKARDTETGMTLALQDLTGARFKLSQRALAEDKARQWAESLTARTGRVHTPFVEQYTPKPRLR